MHRGNHLPGEDCYFSTVSPPRRLLSAMFALAAVTLGPPARAGGDEPAAPLRFANQARETRFDAAWSRSRRNDARAEYVNGLQVSLLFGASPQLERWRIGGASGAMFRAVDDKTFLLSLPYADLTGGIRAAFFEAYAFVGMSWLTVGISHAELAFGGLAPRVGVAAGVQTRPLYVHAFAASEYHPFLVGTSDIRAYVFGLSVALLDRP